MKDEQEFECVLINGSDNRNGDSFSEESMRAAAEKWFGPGKLEYKDNRLIYTGPIHSVDNLTNAALAAFSPFPDKG